MALERWIDMILETQYNLNKYLSAVLQYVFKGITLPKQILER